MTIAAFETAAQAKIAELTQQIDDATHNVSALTNNLASAQQVLTDLQATLQQHNVALTALQGIVPEVRAVLDGLNVEG